MLFRSTNYLLHRRRRSPNKDLLPSGRRGRVSGAGRRREGARGGTSGELPPPLAAVRGLPSEASPRTAHKLHRDEHGSNQAKSFLALVGFESAGLEGMFV